MENMLVPTRSVVHARQAKKSRAPQESTEYIIFVHDAWNNTFCDFKFTILHNGGTVYLPAFGAMLFGFIFTTIF